ncbi:VWA domain-containing protein [Saccharothrix variisporea]|uniref:von Willebrand factor type A domain-containing protein n=1 Tax=Saccharothrix variisporea TaxID=543527 RepID=A0A495XMU1_9PSEU|nr:VWA domain-containing protein [Saccharothrix variisporea]RKT74949.1 von Willebrand factor type A domain-containing protein [Saccharothrix variisporea]
MSQPSPGFQITVDHNKYLSAGQQVIDAVISVSSGDKRKGPAPTAAQVIMIDCSSSMGGDRIVEAKRATAVAVDMLNDGVAFAVVAGTETARMVYPPTFGMVAASPSTKEEARKAIRGLWANGGTAIGTWVDLADRLLAEQEVEIKHGILLTDGHTQRPQELDATLKRCRDHFVCDSRGVGTGWAAATLMAIADALHGSARGLPDPEGLVDEFRAMAESFMSTTIANVALRVWHPQGSRVRFLKEVHPHRVDLTDRRTDVTDQTGDYPTGSWGAETRDYHLSVELPPGKEVGEEVLAALVGVVSGDTELAGGGLVPAVWTDDPALSTMIGPKVAHYTGQVELGEALQSGLIAMRAGRDEEAAAQLGRAAQLAERSGRVETLEMLDKVVHVDDAASARVRIRREMEEVDREMLELQSRTTKRWRDKP